MPSCNGGTLTAEMLQRRPLVKLIVHQAERGPTQLLLSQLLSSYACTCSLRPSTDCPAALHYGQRQCPQLTWLQSIPNAAQQGMHCQFSMGFVQEHLFILRSTLRHLARHWHTDDAQVPQSG